MASSLVEVKTYSTTIANYGTVSETADKAIRKIDVEGIESACKNIRKAADNGIEKINKDIQKVEIDGKVLSVEDKNMKTLMDEIVETLKTIPQEAIQPSLDDIIESAYSEHNKLQKKYNTDAEKRFNDKVAYAKSVAGQN